MVGKKIIIGLSIMALILFSGCDDETGRVNKNSFCAAKGYISYDDSRNWVWLTEGSTNYDFYCIDIKNKKFSERYNSKGGIVEEVCTCPILCGVK